MEKTPEQKQASKERYFAQRNKALEMLTTTKLEDYIAGLKYAYSFCLRYHANLKKLLDEAFGEVKEKCIKGGILKPWNNTYWFDKEKAESLLLWINEHRGENNK